MKVKDLLKPVIAIGCLSFIVCWLIKVPETFSNYLSYLSYSVSIATFCYIGYERWLWKHIPWKRPPVLKKHYDGTLYYTENDVAKTKQIDIHVKQNLFSIKINTQTDINSSYTITASIEKEYDSYFLYYTYITNPDANVQKGNPIQHGTCRMELLEDTNNIKGKYWTTSETIGDMKWVEYKHINKGNSKG